MQFYWSLIPQKMQHGPQSLKWWQVSPLVVVMDWWNYGSHYLGKRIWLYTKWGGIHFDWWQRVNRLLAFAVLALLCGCANMGSFLIPEQDPHLINAEATAKSSEVVVKSFRQYELANRNADLDAKQTARTLETFDEELNDLKTLMKMYSKYRSGENLTELISRTRQVQAARDRAATAMVGGPVERPPFAPPMGSATTLDTILGRLDGIRQEQVATRAALGQLGKAVWELKNTNSVATNAPPVPGK